MQKKCFLFRVLAMSFIFASCIGTVHATNSASPSQAVSNGNNFHDCPECPEMVMMSAGTFNMGSAAAEVGRYENEGPVHSVKVKKFALGKTSVTRAQFAAFVIETKYDAGSECFTFEDGTWQPHNGRNWQNPGHVQYDNHPVACISWNDAKAYADWISKKTGKLYRLPTEAEWEYAARSGTTTARYWGEGPDQQCAYANGMDATGKLEVPGNFQDVAQCTDGYAYTSPAGAFKPNTFGLYDIMGNVWQWTEDCWHDSYHEAPTDGSAWTTEQCSGEHVLRGGSWLNSPWILRAAFRIRRDAGTRGSAFGFRLARTLP